MAWPLASRTISPPVGVRSSSAVIPDSSMALALARRRVAAGVGRGGPGCPGVTLLRASWNGRPSMLGSGARSHFSWCQPRPRIQSPGLAVLAASATRATISSQERALVRSRMVLDWPRPVKWPWLSMSPGMARAPPRSMISVLSADVAVIPLRVRAQSGDAIAAEGDPRGRRGSGRRRSRSCR